jgi:predicted nucleic acid-binding protein
MIAVSVFVDSNVIFDLVTQDPVWLNWSRSALQQQAANQLCTNAMVYAELCSNAMSTDEVDALLNEMNIVLLEMPRAALFVAAKAHLSYRRRGGTKTSPLPDFFIGAHAAILDIPLLTRDEGRYRTYFPQVKLICP